MSEQKRKSISVKPTTYEKLQRHIEECNKDNSGDHRFTISGFVETLVASFFAKLPVADKRAKAPTRGKEAPKANRTPSEELNHHKVQF